MDASDKLRVVLDYVPCDACLSQPVPPKDQALLCSICRRVDRQIGVRVAVKTTVVLERPGEESTSVVIPPAAPAPEPAARLPIEVVFGSRDERATNAAIEVVVVPYEEEPLVSFVAPPEIGPHHVEWEDVASYEPTTDDLFEQVPGGARAATLPSPSPPAEEPPAEIPQDDFVFRPPAAETTALAEREEEPEEDWLPSDDVQVHPDDETVWKEQALAEPAYVPVEEYAPEPAETDVVQDEVLGVVEEEIIQNEIIEEEIVVTPEPSAELGDLWKLRGFDRTAESRLAEANIRELAHLSGHDPVELGTRTGLPPERLASWIHVADLVQEIGIPVAAAISLVAAGVAGPKALREMDPETIVERASAFGGGEVALRDVKRWKRRA